MDAAPRYDPVGFEAGADDELPDYDAAMVPEYDHEEPGEPIHTYYLRQIDRKLQMFVPYGPSASPPYKITSRGPRLFSKKPEIDIWHVPQSAVMAEHVAGIWFDSNGPLPWRPRAHFSHADTQGLSSHAMESRNFTDWTVIIGDTTYAWILEARPLALAFTRMSSHDVIARFTYSSRGTLAMGGAEAGMLTIYRDNFSMTKEGLEKVLCGLVVAIVHFKRMGKHYVNEPDCAIRASSLTGERISSYRRSISTYSTF